MERIDKNSPFPHQSALSRSDSAPSCGAEGVCRVAASFGRLNVKLRKGDSDVR